MAPLGLDDPDSQLCTARRLAPSRPSTVSALVRMVDCASGLPATAPEGASAKLLAREGGVELPEDQPRLADGALPEQAHITLLLDLGGPPASGTRRGLEAGASRVIETLFGADQAPGRLVVTVALADGSSAPTTWVGPSSQPTELTERVEQLYRFRPRPGGAAGFQGALVRAIDQTRAAQLAASSTTARGARTSGHVIAVAGAPISGDLERARRAAAESRSWSEGAPAVSTTLVALGGSGAAELVGDQHALTAPDAAALPEAMAGAAERVLAELAAHRHVTYCSGARSQRRVFSLEARGREAEFPFFAGGFTDGCARQVDLDGLCEERSCGLGICGACAAHTVCRERDGGGSECACPQGSSMRASVSGEFGECGPVWCALGEFVSSNQCAPCPPGTVNAPGDDASGPDTLCDPLLCAEGEFVSSNQCAPCPPGTANPPGDDASGPDTQCAPVSCEDGERVQANACVPCPPGSVRGPGDDATAGDTECDPVLCEGGEFVLAHACAACPAGSLNEPGDDASGPDTQCDPVLCAEDESVVSNQCVACAPETFNAPGDDATAGDTECARDPCLDALGVRCEDFDEAYVKASNPGWRDGFGFSVAVSGDTMAVGAPREDSRASGVNGDQSDNSRPDTGAVYVFTRSGATWTQQAYLKPSDPGAPTAKHEFGWSVALDGDTLAVGAPAREAVYVFERTAGSWSERSLLESPELSTPNKFGWSVALDADTLVAGAYRGNGGGLPSTGSAYVYARTNSTWSRQARLDPSNGDYNDYFGHSVAICGDTIAVGAILESSKASGVNGDQSDNSLYESGAVYVFVRTGTAWAQQAYLKASNPDIYDLFGWSVALDADTLAVGARFEESAATGVNGDQADNSGNLAGAVYVFVRTGTTWAQQAYLKASNTGREDYFGQSMSLDGDTLAVSAHWEDGGGTGLSADPADKSKWSSGAVYLFVRSSGAWAQQAYIKASNTGEIDYFGHSVSLDSGTLVVGAWGEDSGVGGDQLDNSLFEAGAAYVRKIEP